MAMKETRSIKFYLDKSVNKKKKNEIIKFLNECRDVENQLYAYYWENYNVVLKSKTKIDFNRNNKIGYKDLQPQLKSHHFQQVMQDVYGNLMGQKIKIRNSIKIKNVTDSNKYKVYNYCKRFCFEWGGLIKYVNKQIKKYQKQDSKYTDFLQLVSIYLSDEILFNEMKAYLEDEFWATKNKIKCPQIDVPTIWCNTAHTIDLKQESYYNWYFIVDNNINLYPDAKRGLFQRIIIPIKYSDYHYKKLKDKKLNNSFKIGLNKTGQIEIMASYNIDKEYPINKHDNTIGIDIGLKKLIVSSDGEIVEQNTNIIKYADYISKRNSNRKGLERHLKNKYKDDRFRIGNKRILKQNSKLIHMVNCDNRYKIKQFLKGREHDLIVMEDLHIQETHLSRNVNRLLRTLHIQNIKNDILKYCKDYGINIRLVNPAYTSQQCSCCGHIDKGNRKTQEKFSCLKCGFTINADYNASINIRERINIPEIKLNTPNWLIKELIESHYTTCG